MKADAEALGILSSWIDKGYTIQLNKFVRDYEITVWKTSNKDHSHYEGETLVEAVMKAAKRIK